MTAIVEHFGSKPQDHGIVVAFGGRKPVFTPLGTTVYPKGAVECLGRSEGMDRAERLPIRLRRDSDVCLRRGGCGRSAEWAGLLLGRHRRRGIGVDGIEGHGLGTGGDRASSLQAGFDRRIRWANVRFDPKGPEGAELTPTKNPGLVEYYTGGTNFKSGKWIELHGTQWGSGVTKMIPYRSEALGDGVVVGLANGSVHMWNGPLEKPANASDTLNAGNSLKLGETLYSNNGFATLTLQRDGNLVLRQMGKEVWAWQAPPAKVWWRRGCRLKTATLSCIPGQDNT